MGAHWGGARQGTCPPLEKNYELVAQ